MVVKSPVDIEDLVIWAYRHEEVDRRAVERITGNAPSVLGYASTAGSFRELATVGWRIRSANEMIDEPNMDAMRVHDAVLALPELYLEWRAVDEIVMPPWSRSGMLDAGSRIEGQAIVHANGSMSPVERVEPSIAIIVHARASMRPEAWPDWRRPVGRPKSSEDIGYGGDGLSEAHVMRDRARYLIWRQALADLVISLEGKLDGHEVTGPQVSAAPWFARRILKPLETAPNSTALKPMKRRLKKSA